jgi:hypothetical protein
MCVFVYPPLHSSPLPSSFSCQSSRVYFTSSLIFLPFSFLFCISSYFISCSTLPISPPPPNILPVFSFTPSSLFPFSVVDPHVYALVVWDGSAAWCDNVAEWNRYSLEGCDMGHRLSNVYKTEHRLSNDCKLITPGFRMMWNETVRFIRLRCGTVGSEGCEIQECILKSFSVEE